MSSIKSRIAYLRGLMDGLGIKDDSKENRVLIEIVSILEDISEKVEDIEDSQSEFEEYLDSISEDLNDIEEEFYDEYDDEDCDFDDFIELQCSNCNETVYIEEDMLEGHECIKCPNCQAVLINETDKVDEINND